MPEKLEQLYSWRKQLHDELSTLRFVREETNKEIAAILKKLDALDALVRLEGGVVDELPRPRGGRNYQNIERAQSEDGVSYQEDRQDDDDDDAEIEGARRNLTHRWYNFVRDHVEGYGPATVADLYRNAPDHLRRDFESIESKYSPEFRARRLLRRNPAFKVDRTSGIVTLASDLPWPAPPDMPEGRESDLIIESGQPVEDGSYDILVSRSNAPEEVVAIGFLRLSEWLRQPGNFAWVKNSAGILEPVTSFILGDVARIESFNRSRWTDTFDRIARHGASRDSRSAAPREATASTLAG